MLFQMLFQSSNQLDLPDSEYHFMWWLYRTITKLSQSNWGCLEVPGVHHRKFFLNITASAQFKIAF